MDRFDNFGFGGFQFLGDNQLGEQSVTFSPIMWTPSSSPNSASKINLTNPSGLADGQGAAAGDEGEFADFKFLPGSLRFFSVKPMLATCGCV